VDGQGGELGLPSKNGKGLSEKNASEADENEDLVKSTPVSSGEDSYTIESGHFLGEQSIEREERKDGSVQEDRGRKAARGERGGRPT